MVENVFRKGTYAKYKGKEYKFTEADNQNKIELISYDSNDTAEGFVLYSAGIFTKEVILNEVEEIFYIDSSIKYKGEWFKGTKLGNGQLVLSTPDAAIATKFDFERTDKYLYTKNVEWHEVVVFEKKEPYSI